MIQTTLFPRLVLGFAIVLQSAVLMPFARSQTIIEPGPVTSLSDLAFLEGHWRGGSDDFVFEEIWSAPLGHVMTAMARGVRGDDLSVLEYIVVAKKDDAITMRFKHFNADYSVWDGEEESAITLLMTDLSANDVSFTALNGDDEVQSIRYVLNEDEQLTAEIGLLEDGKKSGFTLVFERVDGAGVSLSGSN